MKHARNAAPGLIGVAQNVFASLGPTGKAIAGGVVFVAAATPFGAWSAAADDAIPLAADQTVEVGPYEITVEKVVATKTLGEVVPMDEKNELLVVVAEVKNVSDTPSHSVFLNDVVPAPTGGDIVDAEGKPVPDDVPPGDRPTPRIFNIDDAGSLDVINPDLSYRLALVWERSGTEDLAEIEVRLAGLEWIEEGVTTLMNNYWLPSNEITHSGTFDVEPPKDQPQDGAAGSSNGAADEQPGTHQQPGTATDSPSSAPAPSPSPGQPTPVSEEPEA